MNALLGLLLAFLAGLAAAIANVERIGAGWSPALDAVCSAFVGQDVYDVKPGWPCGLTQRWRYHLHPDEVDSRKIDFGGVALLDYGFQCYRDDDCRSDLTAERAKRCWPLDSGGPSGQIRFCMGRDSHCPFPGSAGVAVGEAPRQWGGNLYRCVPETNGSSVKGYRIEPAG